MSVRAGCCFPPSGHPVRTRCARGGSRPCFSHPLTRTSASPVLLADRMRRRGVNVEPIVCPAVPEAAARLRFFLNASHTNAHIDQAVTILAQETDRPAPAGILHRA